MNIYRSKTWCTIWPPFWFAMAAILNPNWSPKYKNPPIWAKFGFQVDYDVAFGMLKKFKMAAVAMITKV
jgi:hypothetical protein